MVDGVKILIGGLCVNDWLAHRNLDFYYSIDKESQRPTKNRKAYYHGLTFEIKPTVDDPNKHTFLITGSIARYYNKGGNNAFDFTFAMLCDCLDALAERFGFHLYNAHLRGFEFGYNIYTSQPISRVMTNFVALGNRDFDKYTKRGKNIRTIHYDNYTQKLYDKGKDLSPRPKNLLRHEIQIHKMVHIADSDIRTLEDLKDLSKLQSLAPQLIEFWDNVIFEDETVKYNDMSLAKQERYSNYLIPKRWTQYSRMQRMRAKKQYQEIIRQYGTDELRLEILNNATDKLRLLLTENAGEKTPPFNQVCKTENKQGDTKNADEKCIRFNQVCKTEKDAKNEYNFEKDADEKCIRFNPLCKQLKRIHKPFSKPYTKTLKKSPISETQKIKNIETKKARKCGYCETSINHKTPSAKYCSKKCSNKISNKRRTQKNRTRISNEIETLEKLQNQKKPFFISVSYFDDGVYYSDQMTDKDILIPTDWIKKIKGVHVTVDIADQSEPWYPITNPRAKHLIKRVTDINKKKISINQEQNKTTKGINRKPNSKRVSKEYSKSELNKKKPDPSPLDAFTNVTYTPKRVDMETKSKETVKGKAKQKRLKKTPLKEV